ncbi:hypothetical protein RIF29_12687 [Crotalaria pallida]|uniref:Uncharacterized protein n=1 Tax=Crotalaria pallida TaxID=3830 RepID=A0AAN9INI5_CROPI
MSRAARIGWDEWVGMDRLMKDTEETKRIKLELDEKFSSDKKAKCDAGALKTSNGSADDYAKATLVAYRYSIEEAIRMHVARGRKRKNDSVIEGKFDENEVKPIKNEIPPTKFDENEVKPIKNEIKPIRNEIPPTKFDENEVKPIKNEIPPTKFDENEVMPINLEIPPTLWKRLVDDSEFITNLGKVAIVFFIY